MREDRAFSVRWNFGKLTLILRKSWRIYPYIPYCHIVKLSIFPLVVTWMMPQENK